MRLVSITHCERGDVFSGTGGACPFDFIDSFLKPISMVLLKWPERCWVKIALPISSWSLEISASVLILCESLADMQENGSL